MTGTAQAQSEIRTFNESPIHTLICCCCGESTQGRQWWNRDTGFGMCGGCIARIRERGKMPEDEIRNLYGVEGVHYSVRAESMTIAEQNRRRHNRPHGGNAIKA